MKVIKAIEPKVPPDLRKILSTAKTKAQWSDLTPIARRDFVGWIESAKHPETRKRRIERIPDMLAKGKRRPCCYAVVPMDIYRALGKYPKTKAMWSALTPDGRRDFVKWVESAKKKKDQVEAMRKTQKATEAAMQAVILYLRSTKNPTSEGAHKIIDTVLEKHGCESPEGHIVASGTQAVEPHEKGKGPIKRGVAIVIDIYPRSKATGYFADMSRTVCIGPASAEVKKMYDTVLDAQKLAISMIKPGTRCSDIQDSVEKLFMERGYKTSGKGKEFKFAKGFVHSLGHGVGLDIHEAPRIAKGSKDILKEGDIITIEPALYYPELGGIRIEDMALVTENGFENLTDFSKQFEI